MDRRAFLKQPEVSAFVTWLVDRLPKLAVCLRFPHSQFVTGGINQEVTGLEAVLTHYRWRARWFDKRTSESIVSEDWVTTRSSLKRLGAWLRESVANGDEASAGAAAREVLRWGGVRGAIPFIEAKVRRNEWCAYLIELAPFFALDGDHTLEALHAGNVQRFDSGLTKIHALFDVTGSPIYDSRVGAALAMLYEMFRHETGLQVVPPVASRFPVGQARGLQIRNPGELGLAYAVSPQFYTPQVRHHDWARWQLRAGWIIRAVLEVSDLFASEPAGEGADGIAERCHAFEAALFMIGYDLRSLEGGDSREAVHADGFPTVPGSGGNWVPVSHPFRDVLRAYHEFRVTNRDVLGMDAFRQWLEDSSATEFRAVFAQNFTNYRYPFSERELNLADRPLDQIQSIGDGGERGLIVANNGEPEFIAGDERDQVCIVCAGLSGYCYEAETTAEGRTGRLMRSGYAGTENSANTLLYVGRAVGQHFGLLDKKYKPTEFFRRFFGDGFDGFRERLGIKR